MQSLLLKVCLLLGVGVHLGEPGHVQPIRWKDNPPHEAETMSGDKYPFDVLVAADSCNSQIANSLWLPHLPPQDALQEVRAAVVVNFLNPGREHDHVINEHDLNFMSREMSDTAIKNIKQRVKALGIKNFVYLNGETHYFIIAPDVDVLKQHQVFRNARLPLEPSERSQAGLLDSANVDFEKLEQYCRLIATNYTESSVTAPRAHVEAFWKRRPIVRELDGRLSLGIFPFKSPVSRAAASMKMVNRCPVFLVGDAL